MYIHIGSGYVLRRDEIIGIFDMDNTTSSHITRDYLNAAEKRKAITNTAEDIPKSFIVTGTGDVYLSQLMTQTLLKRSQVQGIE